MKEFWWPKRWLRVEQGKVCELDNKAGEVRGGVRLYRSSPSDLILQLREQYKDGAVYHRYMSANLTKLDALCLADALTRLAGELRE